MKKIDTSLFFDKLKEAMSFVWVHKVLWVIGIVAALFGGVGLHTGSRFNFSYNLTSSFPDIFDNSYNYEESNMRHGFAATAHAMENVFDRLISSGAIWLVVGALVCFVIVFWLIGLYVRSTAEVMLIKSVVSPKITFSSLFNTVGNAWLMVVGLQFVLGIIAMIGSLLSLPLICLCCIGVITSLLVSILVVVIYDFAVRFIVLKKAGLIDAINMAWDLIKSNIGFVVMYVLVLWAITLVADIVMLPVIIAIAGIGLLLFFLLLAVTPLLGIITGILVFMIFIVVVVVINGFYSAVLSVYKTKIFLEMVKD